MSSTFDKLAARQSTLSDQHFGEQSIIRTMIKSVNGRPKPDADRPDWQAVGIWSVAFTNPIDIKQSVEVIANTSSVSFDLRSFPTGYLIQIGDRVERLKTGVLYTVTSAEPDGHGRAIYKLNKASSKSW